MGAKGKKRREKNYRDAHGGYTGLPPPPDPSKLDALPSKLRQIISFTQSQQQHQNGPFLFHPFCAFVCVCVLLCSFLFLNGVLLLSGASGLSIDIDKKHKNDDGHAQNVSFDCLSFSTCWVLFFAFKIHKWVLFYSFIYEVLWMRKKRDDGHAQNVKLNCLYFLTFCCFAFEIHSFLFFFPKKEKNRLSVKFYELSTWGDWLWLL